MGRNGTVNRAPAVGPATPFSPEKRTLPVWFRAAVKRAEERPLRLMTSLAFGPIENADYGASGILELGWQPDEVLGVALQGGFGISEDAGLGPRQFSHMALLAPATMTICSSETWICPGSTFELVVLSGLGISRSDNEWVPIVVAGVGLDAFRKLSNIEIGLRAGVQGGYNVWDFERLVVMMQLQLGVIFRFGVRGY